MHAVSGVDFSQPVSAENVEELFRLVLGREVGNEQYKREVEASRVSLSASLFGMLHGREHEERVRERIERRVEANSIGDREYRAPSVLQVADLPVRRVLLVGSCLMNTWEKPILDLSAEKGWGTRIDRVLFGHASPLPPLQREEAATYDFQIIQMPVRAIMPEHLYMGLRYDDEEGYAQAFETACAALSMNVQAALRYATEFGMTTFVLNFMTPQQNPAGRLLPRYRLNNMVYFIEQLNQRLWELCAAHNTVHVIDFDQIVSTLGKRYFQDDSVVHLNHGSHLGDIVFPEDRKRLEPVGEVEVLYQARAYRFNCAAFQEIVGAFRTIRQTDAVKLVIFDLDDTLWRGVAAEREQLGPDLVEGWPLGILEAASYLWRRGVLLAIVSKNDEATAVRIWERLYQRLFPIEYFALRRINWLPKPDNVAEVLRSVNLLPGNVLFVDDNPVERAAVRAAFPGIRTLEIPLANWRRALLWSPELQTAQVTSESVRRTDMIQAQQVREASRSTMSRETFLEQLGVRVRMTTVSTVEDPRFPRAMELVNKTNQFNTTGRRWSLAEFALLFAEGGVLFTYDVVDKHTEYGLVAVIIFGSQGIEQFVMSCRVFGMDVEIAALALAVRELRERLSGWIDARLVHTERNLPCRDVFTRAGFIAGAAELWRLAPAGLVAMPAHIEAML